jgi:hypothetical protein
MFSRMRAFVRSLFRQVPEPGAADVVPTIVEAIGTAVRGSGDKVTAEAIQQAMVEAIKYCYAKGITDSETIRSAQLAAREIVLKRR